MGSTYTTAQVQRAAREIFQPLEDLGIMAHNAEDERSEEWLDDAIVALQAVARIGEIEE